MSIRNSVDIRKLREDLEELRKEVAELRETVEKMTEPRPTLSLLSRNNATN